MVKIPESIEGVSLDEIRKFAEENFAADDDSQKLAVEICDVAVSNPWMDESGRFELTDEQAVQTWGMQGVMDFCAEAGRIIRERNG